MSKNHDTARFVVQSTTTMGTSGGYTNVTDSKVSGVFCVWSALNGREQDASPPADKPVDKYNFVYVILFIQGIGMVLSHFGFACFSALCRISPSRLHAVTRCSVLSCGVVLQLFPWNVFITADSYYRLRFCHSSYESNFQNFFGIAFNIWSVLCRVSCVLSAKRCGCGC